MLTGKKANNGYVVTFSHIRNKKLQHANLQVKKVYWEKEKRFVKLKISTKALKTIQKVGLEKMAKEAGLDLYKLPYTDNSDARRTWLAEHAGELPTRKKHKKGPTPPPQRRNYKGPVTRGPTSS